MSHHRELKNAQQRVLNSAVKLHRKHHFLDMGIGIGYENEVACADVQDAWRHFDHAVEALIPLMRTTDGAAAASGRQTSIAAAKTNLSAKTTWRGKVQRAVLNAGRVFDSHGVIRGGLTCDELELLLGGTHQSISSAVNYAEEHGWIRDSAIRRKTRSGSQAIVYEPTDMLIEAPIGLAS